MTPFVMKWIKLVTLSLSIFLAILLGLLIFPVSMQRFFANGMNGNHIDTTIFLEFASLGLSIGFDLSKRFANALGMAETASAIDADKLELKTVLYFIFGAMAFCAGIQMFAIQPLSAVIQLVLGLIFMANLAWVYFRGAATT